VRLLLWVAEEMLARVGCAECLAPGRHMMELRLRPLLLVGALDRLAIFSSAPVLCGCIGTLLVCNRGVSGGMSATRMC
jgi:hypothetical protein